MPVPPDQRGGPDPPPQRVLARPQVGPGQHGPAIEQSRPNSPRATLLPKRTKVYGLLEHALEESNRAGIATFVMRGREYLVALKAEKGLLAVHTLHWSDEIRDPHQEIPDLPKTGKASAGELKMAHQLFVPVSEPSMTCGGALGCSVVRAGTATGRHPVSGWTSCQSRVAPAPSVCWAGTQKIIYLNTAAVLAVASVLSTAGPAAADSSSCTHHFSGPQACVRLEGSNSAWRPPSSWRPARSSPGPASWPSSQSSCPRGGRECRRAPVFSPWAALASWTCWSAAIGSTTLPAVSGSAAGSGRRRGEDIVLRGGHQTQLDERQRRRGPYAPSSTAWRCWKQSARRGMTPTW
ncbi:Ku protein [Streptomyces sp. NPDC090045]|uniref:Ku protein n=1 Tax=Streptomyces sp. NPDC090045 TaxID=3365927 RepID=UPI003804D561